MMSFGGSCPCDGACTCETPSIGRAPTIAVPRAEIVEIDSTAHTRPTLDLTVTDPALDTFVVDVPNMPRTVTGDLRARLETAERQAVAAGCAQRLAEEARAKAEERNQALMDDVASLWAALGSLLAIMDPKSFTFPRESEVIGKARDLHARWEPVDDKT